MILLSIALRPLPWRSCWRGREGVHCYLSVSNTINIITYTDVWHDWRDRGGAGGVEGLLGRMGVGGGDGWFSSMLTIGHNVRDTKNYVKSLVISHNMQIYVMFLMGFTRICRHLGKFMWNQNSNIPHLDEWKRHTHTRAYTYTHTHT